MAVDSQAVLDRIEVEKESYLEDLKSYLKIPSISTDPAHDEDVSSCCDFLLRHMRDAGLTCERVDTDRHPLAYGEWLGAEGKPTVLFYGHYDVQPPDPLELWRNPPFEPTVEGDLLVARGATDDKGQSFTHVKAVGAMLAERGELPVNVKFLVEGEEESGGESIDSFVRQDAGDRLPATASSCRTRPCTRPDSPRCCTASRGWPTWSSRSPGHAAIFTRVPSAVR